MPVGDECLDVGHRLGAPEPQLDEREVVATDVSDVGRGEPRFAHGQTVTLERFRSKPNCRRGRLALV
jgi:hypothetical protein